MDSHRVLMWQVGKSNKKIVPCETGTPELVGEC